MKFDPSDGIVPARMGDDAQELYNEALKISGPFKEDHWSEKYLYASYHYPQFNYPKAFRNTEQRFWTWQFGNYRDRTLLDFGSNLGGMALEFARMGVSVTGLEYCQDRVDWTNKLARFLNADAKFYRAGIGEALSDEVIDVLKQEYDITTAFSIDTYVDKDILFEMLAKTTKRVCFLEGNDPKFTNEQYKSLFLKHGFVDAKFVNYSEKGTSPEPRRLFVAGKTEDMRVGGRSKKLPDGRWEKQFVCYDELVNQRQCFTKLLDLPQTPQVEFTSTGQIIYPDCGTPISELQLSAADKESYGRQLVDFIFRGCGRHGVSHRDLHPGNLLVKNGQLSVIDWDWATITPNYRKWPYLYDLDINMSVSYPPKKLTPICWWPWLFEIVPISIFEKPRRQDDQGQWLYSASTAELLGLTQESVCSGPHRASGIESPQP